MSVPMHDPNKTQLGAPPVMDPNRTVMGSPSFDATVTIKPVQCPVCKSFNPVGVKFCVECGLIFDMALDGDAFGAPTVLLPVLVDQSGKELRLRPGRTVIGRQGDIVVEDTRVSRQHAAVTMEGTDIAVEDIGSTNGTSVNGQKLASGEKRNLTNGDQVSFGGYEATLSLPGEANKTFAAMSGKTAAIQAALSTGQVVATLVFTDREVPLKPGTHSFGRRDGNDIVVSDPYVSGKHGEFEVTDTEVSLKDTGSTNGTVVNDAKLPADQETKLQNGDVIKLGQIEITVKFGA